MHTAAAPSAVTPFYCYLHTVFILFADTLLMLYLLIAVYIVQYLLPLVQILWVIPFCLYTLNLWYM